MRHSISTFLLALLTLLGAGCEKDEIPPIGQLPADYINFNDLKVGQRSYYLLADLEFRGGPQRTSYTGDTLVLEITGQEGDLFLVRETLTAGSPNRDTVITRYCNVTEYGLRVENGVLTAVRTVDCLYSHLFDELPRSLPLTPLPDSLATLDGWLVQPFDDGNDDLILYGYVEGFSSPAAAYSRLSLLVDPSLEPLDGNKNYWLYKEEFGLVRFVSFNGFSGRGRLADLWISEK